jgi:hypothetical protein
LTTVRTDLAGLRSDFSGLQDRLIQIGSGLVAALLAALIVALPA